MRELRRRIRVNALRAQRDPRAKFYLIIVASHVGFVLGYATMTILQAS